MLCHSLQEVDPALFYASSVQRLKITLLLPPGAPAVMNLRSLLFCVSEPNVLGGGPRLTCLILTSALQSARLWQSSTAGKEMGFPEHLLSLARLPETGAATDLLGSPALQQEAGAQELSGSKQKTSKPAPRLRPCALSSPGERKVGEF